LDDGKATVSGDEIGFEFVEFGGVFEAHDGEVGAGEAVLEGVGGVSPKLRR
jgi:hypothetical protein